MNASGKPKLIGLVGAVACGKSTVAKLLAQHGGLWLDSDKTAHEVLNEPNIVRAISARFGATVIGPGGIVDRKALATRVFGDSPEQRQARKWLEQCVHPRVRARTEERIRQAGNTYPVIILDAPLLIEAGWGPMCDRILFVDTPQAKRESFAAARGWTTDQLRLRDESQMPIDEKRKAASDILENNGSPEELADKVALFWKKLFGEQSASTDLRQRS